MFQCIFLISKGSLCQSVNSENGGIKVNSKLYDQQPTFKLKKVGNSTKNSGPGRASTGIGDLFQQHQVLVDCLSRGRRGRVVLTNFSLARAVARPPEVRLPVQAAEGGVAGF